MVRNTLSYDDDGCTCRSAPLKDSEKVEYFLTDGTKVVCAAACPVHGVRVVNHVVNSDSCVVD